MKATVKPKTAPLPALRKMDFSHLNSPEAGRSLAGWQAAAPQPAGANRCFAHLNSPTARSGLATWQAERGK
jgi:hypothetical protein